MTGMIHDIEPNTSPVPASLQTQLDRLAERVGKVEDEMEEIRGWCGPLYANDAPTPPPAPARDRGVMLDPDGMAMPAKPPTLEELEAKRKTVAPAPDETAKWRQVAHAIRMAGASTYYTNDTHAVALAKAAVKEAIALGLVAPADPDVANLIADLIEKSAAKTRRIAELEAAPADRVVCEVTEAEVDAAISAFILKGGYLYHEKQSSMKAALQAAADVRAAAYWSAGADTQGEE